MVAGTETVSTSQTTRASQLIAEALVNGHDREVIVQRARSMGLSSGLTDIVVAACPCRHSTQSRASQSDRSSSPRRAAR